MKLFLYHFSRGFCAGSTVAYGVEQYFAGHSLMGPLIILSGVAAVYFVFSGYDGK